MKKAVWILLATIAAIFVVRSCMISDAKQEARRAESLRLREVAESEIRELVERTNAVGDWQDTLSKGEAYRLEPILTVELERLWLHERPILFMGSIKDIATHDASRYLVAVEQNYFAADDYAFDTGLELSLVGDKSRMDAFVKANPELFANSGLNNAVAVIALIHSIDTRTVAATDGATEDTKVGRGELVDLIYTGDLN